MTARRRDVPSEVADSAGEAVAHIVAEAPAVLRARRVALYADAGGELPTRNVFERLAAADRPTLLPRVRGEGLEWAAVRDWSSLRPGRFGILEPLGPADPAPGPADLVLLPGLAFDETGWRLGRGGGFYDRAFPDPERAPLRVGIGFAFQRIASVPHDSRDRRVDAIVTELGWVWCREEE